MLPERKRPRQEVEDAVRQLDVKWLWEQGGRWKFYTKEESETLEANFHDEGVPNVTFTNRNGTFTIHFQGPISTYMTQTSEANPDRSPRKVLRVAILECGHELSVRGVAS